eukprot:CAMPEP_0178992768 /NCGR_PEP_ID=MMETSP0795-20121207/6303_1 /TAXON_ID=88552 /ORGANISM="Amoebophrya sp., Strain Ameob2" /LENGTH=1250 /DNA_ID=CAMNT_0020684697 /DNA_START=264 /DNA_END=4016 /DNA_ORIENTATION=-
MYSSGEYLEFRIDRLSGDPLTIRFPNVAAAAGEFSPSAALRRASDYNDAKNGSSGGMSPSGFMDFMRQNDFRFQPPARGGGAGGPAGVPALGAVVTDEHRSTTEDASRGTLLLTSGIVSVRRLRDRIRKFLQQDEAGRPVPDQVVMLIHPPAEDSGGADVVFQGDDTAADFWSRVFAGAADADLCQISLPAHPKKKDRFRAVPPEWCETVWRTFPVVLNSCAVRVDFANRRVVNFVAGRNAQLVYDSEADIVSLEHFEGTSTAADVPDGTPGGANEMGAGTASTSCSTSTPTPEFLPLNDLQLVTRSYPQLVLRDMVDSLRDVIETGGRLQLIRRDSYSIGDWATAVYQANVYELNSSDWVARCLPPLVSEEEAALPAAAGDEHEQTGGAGGPGLRTISSESRGEAAVAETNMRNHFANDQHGRYLSCNPNPRNLRGVYGSAGLESHPIYNANMNATYMKRLSGGKDGNQPSLLMQLLEMIFRLYQKYHAEPITEEWREALDRHIVECQCVILLLLRTPLLRDVHPGGWENQDDSPNGDSASSRYNGRGPRSTSTAVESPLHELLRMYFLFSRTTSNFPGSEKYRSLRYFGGSSSAGARAAGASSGVFPGTRLNRRQHSTNASSGAEDEPEQSRQLIENIISINDGGAGASSGAAATSLSTAGAYLAAHEVVEETASNWIFAAFAEILHHPDCRADRMVNRFGQTPLYIAYEVYWEDKAAFTGSSSGCFAEDFGAFRKYYGAGTAGSSSSGSILRAAVENLAMGGNLDDLREQFAAEVDWAALANGLLASGGSALHPTTAAQRPGAGAGSVTKILSGADMFRALVLDGAARAPATIVKQLREVLYCQLANGLEDRDWLVLLADLVELLGTSTSSGGGCLDAVLHQVADAADESRGSNTLLQLVLLSLSVESFTPHAWQSNRLAVDYGTAIFQMAPSVGQEAVSPDDHDMGVPAQQDGEGAGGQGHDQNMVSHEVNDHDEKMRNQNHGFQVSAALFDRLVRTGLAVRVEEPGLDAGISAGPQGKEQVAHFASSDATLGFLSSCPSKVLPLEEVGALKAFVIRTLFATGSAVMGATKVRIIRGPGGNAGEVDEHGEKMKEVCSEILPTADTTTADDAPDRKPTATHVDFSGSQVFFTDKERAEPTAAHIRRGTLLLRHRLLPIVAWSVGHANNNLLHRNGRGENVLHCLFQAKNFSFIRHMICDKQYGWPFLELLFSGIRNAGGSETEVWGCKDSSGWTPAELLKLFVKEHL